MTLCDAGPLIAMVNARDVNHAPCVGALAGLTHPLVTTWPCFAEAMYLLHREAGYPGQAELWDYVRNNLLSFHVNSDEEIVRMEALMRQYRDRPMDLADASLVAAAESLGQTRVFTVDRDFLIYRLHGTTPFEVVP